MALDLCPDCHRPIRFHFRTDADHLGEYRGCPIILSDQLVALEGHTRVMFRIGIGPALRGHVLVAWADSRDDDGQVLVWDMDADTYTAWDHLRLRERTRAPSNDRRADIKEKVESELGFPVRVVRNISAGQGTAKARAARRGTGTVESGDARSGG